MTDSSVYRVFQQNVQGLLFFEPEITLGEMRNFAHTLLIHGVALSLQNPRVYTSA